MIFYHYTKPENVESVLSEGLKLSRASYTPACICLCINDKDWAPKEEWAPLVVCLRVTIPDEKVVYFSYLDMGNFNGKVLKLAEDIPPEWSELIEIDVEQMKVDTK